MGKVEIEIKMKLPATIEKKKVGWVSSCPILDVVSQGDTKKEAKKNLKEAIALFLTSCFTRGTLEKVLKDCGFTPSTEAHPKTKPTLPQKQTWLDDPSPL